MEAAIIVTTIIAVVGIKMFPIMFLQTILTILDWVLYPFYYLFYNPTKLLKSRAEKNASIEKLSNSEILIRPKFATCKVREEMDRNADKIHNIYDMFSYSARKFASKKCLGRRPLLGETKVNVNGKIEEKLKLGDEYLWNNFKEVEEKIVSVSNGLTGTLNLKSRDNVIIFADTCIEWFVTVMACFRNNYPVATLYTNLGADGIRYGIQQTSPKVIFTSQHLVPKLQSILSSFPNKIKFVVYFEHPLKKNSVFEEHESANSIPSILPLSKIETSGQMLSGLRQDTVAKGDDVAIIMYTSGSTGNPKGVMLTHNNVLSQIKQIIVPIIMSIGEIQTPEDCFIGYLPLAHIFELCMEFAFIALGIPIGYSSPYTLTDNSLKVIKGEKGDISILKPTIMIAVPIILDRLYKGIRLNIKNKGEKFEKIFNTCVQYKRKWQIRGFDTPIMNKILFKKIRATLGGRVKAAFCGGAPVTADVQEYLRICLCAKFIQGYGLTECCGGITASYGDDISLGEVGVVFQDSLLKLETWEEGGYTVNDKIGSRGEIILSGGAVSIGYYKCSNESDNSAFYKDAHGRSWFRTGDIGQLMPKTGTIKIVDRRKDLVKLQMGEYVSLSKVEAVVKLHSIVDTVCVYADPEKTSVVALIVPMDTKLQDTRNQLGLSSSTSKEELCANETLIDVVLKEIIEMAKPHLERFETPRKIALLPTTWTPDTGLVTAAMKLRRKQIKEKYQMEIDGMYRQLEHR